MVQYFQINSIFSEIYFFNDDNVLLQTCLIVYLIYLSRGYRHIACLISNAPKCRYMTNYGFQNVVKMFGI